MRSFRLVHTGKGRFWEVHWEGPDAETTSGALGTGGRSTSKSFGDGRAADAWVAEQIAKKRKEGFVELTDVGNLSAPVATDATLLERIIASPDDDDLRLVYADQLTASGDPLGELITVQVNLARAPDGPEAAVLRHRERELLERFRARWSGNLRGVDFRFERGFAVEARMQVEDLVTHAASLWKAAPLLERVHVSALNAWRSDDALRLLVNQPGVARLRELHVTHGAPAIAAVVASATQLRGLEALSLRRLGVADSNVEELLAAPHLGTLRRVDFRGNLLAGGAMNALCQRPLVKLGFAGNRLGQSSVSALGKATSLSALEALDLSHNGIGDVGLEVLGRAAHFANVKVLSLAHVNATLRGVEALGGGELAKHVTQLDLSGNALRAEGLRRVLSGAFASLTHLDVSEAMLGDDGVTALLESRGAAQLVSLELRRNALTWRAAKQLAEGAGALPRLEYVTVSGNPLGEKGVAVLKKALPRVQIVARKAALEDD